MVKMAAKIAGGIIGVGALVLFTPLGYFLARREVEAFQRSRRARGVSTL